MPLDANLLVTLTRTFDHKPLVVVDNLPGNGAELRPDELRSLAEALLAAAEESSALDTSRKNWLPVKREYDLAPPQAANPAGHKAANRHPLR